MVRRGSQQHPQQKLKEYRMTSQKPKPVRRKSVRLAALDRDKRCVKCCGTQSLEVHHIVPIADGGADDLKNVDVLCSPCHSEWHKEAEGHVPYEDFLFAIPMRMLSRFSRIPEMANLPVSDHQKWWNVVCMHRAAKSFGNYFEVGDRGEMIIQNAA